METTKVKVLDYYNKPAYYPFMPGEIFGILESAFLNDEENVELPKILFDKMIEDYNAKI